MAEAYNTTTPIGTTCQGVCVAARNLNARAPRTLRGKQFRYQPDLREREHVGTPIQVVVNALQSIENQIDTIINLIQLED